MVKDFCGSRDQARRHSVNGAAGSKQLAEDIADQIAKLTSSQRRSATSVAWKDAIVIQSVNVIDKDCATVGTDIIAKLEAALPVSPASFRKP